MGLTNLSFADAVADWADATEAQLRWVFRASAQDVIEAMQEVGPSKANPDSTGTGRMPVDFGFLRASLVVQLNADPPPANRESDGVKRDWNPAAATLVINQAEIGDRITAGYTAIYARRVNYSGYNWVAYAEGQWQQIVRRNAERAKGIAA